MKHITIVVLLFMVSAGLHSSTGHTPLCMNNENVIFSFMTKNNKIMSICVSKDESYIVYRYGTKDKIELEYPKNKKDSWLKFKYTSYFRGGGTENEGIDLNYLIFNNDGYTYTIFQEYHAVENTTNCGIRIEHSKNKIEINGDYKSAIGSLVDLRDNENIKKED